MESHALCPGWVSTAVINTMSKSYYFILFTVLNPERGNLRGWKFRVSITFSHFIANSPLSRKFRAGMQCRNLKQGPDRNVAYRLAPHGLLTLLSCATNCKVAAPGSIGHGLSHQSSGRKMPYRLASRQYDGGHFSVEHPLPKQS